MSESEADFETPRVLYKSAHATNAKSVKSRMVAGERKCIEGNIPPGVEVNKREIRL